MPSLTFLEILWFLLYYCYIYHHITCDTLHATQLEKLPEVGKRMLESQFKVRKV